MAKKKLVHVHCALPNASGKINGVAFEPHESGVRTGPIAHDVAKQFEGIKGYSIFSVKEVEPAPAKKTGNDPAVQPPNPDAGSEGEGDADGEGSDDTEDADGENAENGESGNATQGEGLFSA